jgi:hypothetical protein
MDFIGLFFVASILSLLVAQFAETLRTHRPRHAAVWDEALWVERSLPTQPVYAYTLLSAYSRGGGQG